MTIEKDIDQLLESARAARRDDNYERASWYLERGFEQCQEDDHLSLGKLHSFRGQLLRDNDSRIEALEAYHESWESYDKHGEPSFTAHAIRHIADIEQEMGRFSDSQNHYQIALALYRSIPEPGRLSLANALMGFASLQEKLKNVSIAKKLWSEARELYVKSKLEAGVEMCDAHLKALN